jgi:alpha-galactosidase
MGTKWRGAALTALAAAMIVVAFPPGAWASSGPPMGYNNWSLTHCSGLSESEIMSQAQALVNTGLAAAGYNTVVIDDCWMAAQRTTTGQLTWNTTKFPDGIPAVIAKLHAMGLKAGLYEDAGLRTCALLPGDLGHYGTDAATFASWGVDYVKIDMCQFPKGTTFSRIVSDFTQLGSALAASGRSMAYIQELPVKALVDYGWSSPQYRQAIKASAAQATAWRVSRDERMKDSYSSTVMTHLAQDLPLYKNARAGHWNDLDMLLAGNPNYGWTDSQAISQMSIWAGLASPLMISTDLTTLSPALLADLENPAMIAIDQSGVQGHLVTSQGPIEAVRKPDPQGGTALLLVNTSGTRSTFDVPLSRIGVRTGNILVTNIWSGSSFRAINKLRYTVRAHSAALLQLH